MTKIAISNLAWRKPEDEEVFGIMHELGVLNLEISPFRDAATLPEVKRQFNDVTAGLLDKCEIRIVAFQALMFRYLQVSIFENEHVRNEIFAHLVNLLKFSNQVGSTVVVFGSPKNKIKGGRLSHEEAMNIAREFFEKLAKQAEALNITFCIEPTPSVYGADFICNTQEAVDFVRIVGHKSLRVNLDIGSSILNNENIEKIIASNIEHIGHVHVSEPYLRAINFNHSFHQDIARALKANNYKGVISIEMLPTVEQNTKNISETILFIGDIYQ